MDAITDWIKFEMFRKNLFSKYSHSILREYYERSLFQITGSKTDGIQFVFIFYI